MPLSLIPEKVVTGSIPLMYQNCCSPEILDTARYLKFFLLFRHGAAVRDLNKDEYQYLVLLERFVHKQLLDQAGRYHESHTINEVLVLALSATRMTVLCIWEQHRQLRRMLSIRLVKALSVVSFQTWKDQHAVKALIWACWVFFTTSDFPGGQDVALHLLTEAIKMTTKLTDLRTAAEWLQFFSYEIEPLLWHKDWEAHISRISDAVVQRNVKDRIGQQ